MIGKEDSSKQYVLVQGLSPNAIAVSLRTDSRLQIQFVSAFILNFSSPQRTAYEKVETDSAAPVVLMFSLLKLLWEFALVSTVLLRHRTPAEPPANWSKHIFIQKRFWPQQPHPSSPLYTKPHWPNSIKLSAALKQRGRERAGRKGARQGKEKPSCNAVISSVGTVDVTPATAATALCYESWAGRKWKEKKKKKETQ